MRNFSCAAHCPKGVTMKFLPCVNRLEANSPKSISQCDWQQWESVLLQGSHLRDRPSNLPDNTMSCLHQSFSIVHMARVFFTWSTVNLSLMWEKFRKFSKLNYWALDGILRELMELWEVYEYFFSRKLLNVKRIKSLNNVGHQRVWNLSMNFLKKFLGISMNFRP